MDYETREEYITGLIEGGYDKVDAERIIDNNEFSSYGCVDSLSDDIMDLRGVPEEMKFYIDTDLLVRDWQINAQYITLEDDTIIEIH